ncbi:DUF305 domain-containing protein [Luedemannella helvata]|uniref:DUF305 domain-containing protein n=1 Tax=Luedemannella helvata TaxID=349315 RepID=A0ABN2KLQ0_9ACTN
MSRFRTAAVLAALALVLGGCAGDHSGMPHMSGPSVIASDGAVVANQEDVMFAQMMIPHHQQAVEMSDLAPGRASDPELSSLAAQIRAAQAPEIATMSGWLTAWGRPTHMPATMGHGMPGMVSAADMAKLRAASGREFDRLYATLMIAHHEGAIDMAETELAGGANADAKALAQQIITSQQAEIATMRAMLQRL